MIEIEKEEEIISARRGMEIEWEFRKWVKEIPFIPFKRNWLVKPIPPFGGAISRFCVQRLGSDTVVSVYLDCYDALGCYGSPYWEVHPDKDGDCSRCDMEDIDQLVKNIAGGLRYK